MNEMNAILKEMRILEMYIRFTEGKIVNKQAASNRFGVTERTIQRDINDLRAFLSEQHTNPYCQIIYDRKANGYRLIEQSPAKFTNEQALAVIKILLESRSMRRDELFPIIDKLLSSCVSKQDIPAIRQLVANEQLHYIEPHHGKKVLSSLWTIGDAITHQKKIDIRYTRLKDQCMVERRLLPVGIMFSEYYFYLVGFIDDERTKANFDNPNDIFPTIYRVDRMTALHVTDTHFKIPYAKRFQEGEFRKRIQFMFGGRLRNIVFRYKGLSIEAVLDRLPTAEIISQDENGWVISAEVFGDGIDMWLRSQGQAIEIIS